MRALVDIETFELILALIGSLWPQPLEADDVDQWRRMLSPIGGPVLDPELVAQTLLLMHHGSAHEIVRPTVEAFRVEYDRLFESSLPVAPDPGDQPATTDCATEHLEHCRSALAAVGRTGSGRRRDDSRRPIMPGCDSSRIMATRRNVG